MSPCPVAAMKVVIVSKPSSGLRPEFGCRPAAISTIIVSPIARETPSTIAATMPESAAGKTTRSRDLHPRGTEAVGALAQALRHRGHRVLGDRGDRRQDHDRRPRPRRRARSGSSTLDAEETLEDQRGDEGQGEEPEDDRRHPDQHLEDRLDDPRARAASRTRRGRSPSPSPSGIATQDRDAGDQEGAVDQLPDAVLGVREQRRPLASVKKLVMPTSLKKSIVSLSRAYEDPDRRQDRDRRRGEEADRIASSPQRRPADAEGLRPSASHRLPGVMLTSNYCVSVPPEPPPETASSLAALSSAASAGIGTISASVAIVS